MPAARAAAMPALGLRQDGQPGKSRRLADQHYAASVDLKMVQDLPEKRRRFGISERPEAEHQRGRRIDAAGRSDPHPEIGDHMAEMAGDRAAPEARICRLDRLIRPVRLGIGKTAHRPPTLGRGKLRVGIKPRIKIRPVRLRRKRLRIDGSGYRPPAVPCKSLPGEMWPLRTAAEKGAGWMKHLLGRMDDHILEGS